MKLKQEIKNFNEVLQLLMPQFIKDRILKGEIEIEEDQGELTILFCDICDFEEIVQIKQNEIAQLLDDLFRVFDNLCSVNSVQKIETVGKTYMAAAGFKQQEIDQNKNSTQRIFNMACQMQQAAKNISYSKEENKYLTLKIGIHYGKAIAGVIGYHKPQFSLIGDTINTTSRVCSTSENGSLTLSQQAFEQLKQKNIKFQQIDVQAKGKGIIKTFKYIKILNKESNFVCLEENILSKRTFNQKKLTKIFQQNQQDNIQFQQKKYKQISFKNMNLISNQKKLNSQQKFQEDGNQIFSISPQSCFKNNQNVKKKFQMDGKIEKIASIIIESDPLIENNEVQLIKTEYINILQQQQRNFDIFQNYSQSKNVQIKIQQNEQQIFNSEIFNSMNIPTTLKKFIEKYNKYQVFMILSYLLLLFLLDFFEEFNFINILSIILKFLNICSLIFRQTYILAIVFSSVIFYFNPINHLFLNQMIIFNFVLLREFNIKKKVFIIFFYIAALILNYILNSIPLNWQIYFLLPFSNLVIILVYNQLIISIYQQYVKNDVLINEQLENQNKILPHILPEPIRTKFLSKNPQQEDLIEKLEMVTILFADIAGFTKYSSSVVYSQFYFYFKEPEEVVVMLRNLFIQFDQACLFFEVYKLYTIGDCYVIIGLQDARERDFHQEVIQQAINVIEMGFKMIDIIEEVKNQINFKDLNMRIGIHTGDIIGGVIGTDIVRYDIYGENVTIANKMESNGEIKKIMISEDTYNLINNLENYNFEFSKTVEMKNSGRRIDAYFIERKQE